MVRVPRILDMSASLAHDSLAECMYGLASYQKDVLVAIDPEEVYVFAGQIRKKAPATYADRQIVEIGGRQVFPFVLRKHQEQVCLHRKARQRWGSDCPSAVSCEGFRF